MKPYGNQRGRSGVTAFENRDRSIVIEFRNGSRYLYDYERPGREHVEEMKRLAEMGSGLSAYVSKNVRTLFAKKL